MKTSKRICFFAQVRDRSLLELVQWYKNDLRILKELGHEVAVATRFREIPWNYDLYFSWWATTSIFPLIKATVFHKPLIVVAGGSEVVHLAEEPTAAAFRNKPLFVQAAVRLCLRHATRVLCVSQNIKHEVDALGATHSMVVYHGIDTDTYKPQIRQKDNIIFTISHVTHNHIKRKRLLEIIEAAKIVLSKFPDYRFVIAGAATPAIDTLAARIRQIGVTRNVIIVERMTEREKLDTFAKSKVYLQPTLHEGFGVSIAEAMSCGVPVVTSRVAAVPEVVGDCGLYVDPYDVEDIAAKVIMLLEDEGLRKDLSVRGRRRIVERFSYEKRKETLSRLIQELVDTHVGA